MRLSAVLPIPEDLALELESTWPDPVRRAAFVTDALRAQLLRSRPGQDQADLAIINDRAAELNAEAEDVLEYQVIP